MSKPSWDRLSIVSEVEPVSQGFLVLAADVCVPGGEYRVTLTPAPKPKPAPTPHGPGCGKKASYEGTYLLGERRCVCKEHLGTLNGAIQINALYQSHRVCGVHIKPSPKPEPPSWDDAPEWAQWIAQDQMGEWRWYRVRPTLPVSGDVFYWLAKGGSYEVHRPISYVCNPNWRDTLQQRPKPEPVPRGSLRCKCGWTAKLIIGDDGYSVECPMCDRKTSWFQELDTAIYLWRKFVSPIPKPDPAPEPVCPVCGKPASEHKDGLFCCPRCGGVMRAFKASKYANNQWGSQCDDCWSWGPMRAAKADAIEAGNRRA